RYLNNIFSEINADSIGSSHGSGPLQSKPT
ncbi:MAG: hypothetical protein ACI9GB_003379, partial [Halioglobus sp.]